MKMIFPFEKGGQGGFQTATLLKDLTEVSIRVKMYFKKIQGVFMHEL